MSKMALICGSRAFLGLKSVGIDVLEAKNSSAARDILDDAVSRDLYSVIFIIEDLAGDSMDIIDRWNKGSKGVIVPIPGTKGGGEVLSDRISELAKSAVGSDISIKK